MVLRGLWYFAAPAAALRPGRLLARRLLGQPVVLGRTRSGSVFALRDICPHRGIPLSEGCVRGEEIECCYHGWRFDAAGRCTAIPSLVEGQRFDLAKIRVAGYPVAESQGLIWIRLGDEAPPPPLVPHFTRAPNLVVEARFPCPADHAVVGLMDPAHGPFVHAAWWWRSRRSAYEKEKRFAPSELGFTMLRHRPSRNSAAYRLLGGAPETEIRFMLPGLRFEHITAGRHVVCGLTAVTPSDERGCVVHHAVWWSSPLLSALRPLLRRFARAFLAQDRRVVARQQVGLAWDPPLMLVDDADTQAKWYYRLKKDYARAVEAGRPFENPLKETTLRWRS